MSKCGVRIVVRLVKMACIHALMKQLNHFQGLFFVLIHVTTSEKAERT